jgi:hypothetical protein
VGLTPFITDLILPLMGDKSPKAAQKQAAQKQLRAEAAKQKRTVQPAPSKLQRARNKSGDGAPSTKRLGSRRFAAIGPRFSLLPIDQF